MKGTVMNPMTLVQYTYVLDNPLKYVDLTGELVILAVIAIGAAIGALVGGGINLGTQIVNNRDTDNEIEWKSLGISALAGAAGGAVGGGVGAALTGAFSGAAAGTLTASSLTLGQAVGTGAFSAAASGIGSRSVYFAFDPCG